MLSLIKGMENPLSDKSIKVHNVQTNNQFTKYNYYLQPL